MDRETLAQAVAMLVILAALARWLPPAGVDDALGRGDPWRSIEVDRSLLDEAPDSLQGAATLRAMFKRDGSIGRWRRLLEQARTLGASCVAGDVVQLRGLGRNDQWSLTYDLYPAHVVGTPMEEGGSAQDAVRADAVWVLTLAGPKADPLIERGPAHADAGAAPGAGDLRAGHIEAPR